MTAAHAWACTQLDAALDIHRRETGAVAVALGLPFKVYCALCEIRAIFPPANHVCFDVQRYRGVSIFLVAEEEIVVR